MPETKETSTALQKMEIEELSEIWNGLIQIREILLEQKNIYMKFPNQKIVEIELSIIDRRIRQLVLELDRRCTSSPKTCTSSK